MAILGGAKVSDKIELIEKLLSRVNSLLIGGAMAYTFLVVKGIPVGASLVETDKLDLARDLMNRASAAGVNLELPKDHVTAASIGKRSAEEIAPNPEPGIPEGRMGVDIGPATLALWKEILGPQIKTVLWNGPVGLFEAAGVRCGDTRVGPAPARRPPGLPVCWGAGTLAAAAAQFGLEQQYDHVSTGGGAA